MLKVMWASKMVPIPNFIPKLIKRSINEIPVTISAFSIGMLVMPIIKARLRFPIFWMAIHATVPIMTAVKDDRRAIKRVFHKACMISLLSKRETYHFNVKPPHFARVRLALKESAINVAMGA